jgi:hypothetical protein
VVCKSQFLSFRLVSLLEILRAFADQYIQIAVNLDTTNVCLRDRDIWQDDELRHHLVKTLEGLGEVCVTGEMPVTRQLVDKTLAALTDPAKIANSDLFQRYLFDLRNRFIAEAGTKLFFQVPSAKMAYYDSPRQGWEKVIERFPDAIGDVEEMSKCFALSRYAGAVFHSLLVVEHGLIALGHEIGVSDPKPGWDATCREMKRLIDAGHSKYPATLRVGFNSLEQIHQSAQTMKLAWRNKVSHAANQLVVLQSDFTPDICEEIMLATRSFMRRLASDLTILVL